MQDVSTEAELKQRTIHQNSAMHKYYEIVAGALNDAGLEMKVTLEKGTDIPWSSRAVKEYLWRPIQKIQLGKDSTTELTTKEIDIVYDTLNRYLAENFGLEVSFPSIESLIMNQRIENE